MIPVYARRIREIRQNAGLTQAEFATLIGTTKNQLSKYELNTQDTPLRIVIAICEQFKVDPSWLLGMDETSYAYSADEMLKFYTGVIDLICTLGEEDEISDEAVTELIEGVEDLRKEIG